MPESSNLIAQLQLGFQRVGTVAKSHKDLIDANTSAISSNLTTVRGEITTAVNNMKSEILGADVKATLDTLKEIGDYAEANKDLIDSLTELANGHVHFDKAQTLTTAQQAQARSNIAAADDADVVKLSSQSLTDANKTQVRTNLSVPSVSDLETVAASVTSLGNDVVKTSAQTLTATAQTQARTNIGAASAADLTSLATNCGDFTNMDFVTTFNTAYTATSSSSSSSSGGE